MASNSPRRYCSVCGAEVRADSVLCWCCRHSLLTNAMVMSPLAAVEAIDKSGRQLQDRTRFQFSLASLMLIVTFAAVLMSIYTMVPGLGITLFVLALPALVRTIMLATRKRAEGRPMSMSDKIAFFLVWIGLGSIFLAVIGVSAVAMLFAICASASTSHRADPAPYLVMIGIGTLIVLSLLIWAFRRIVKRF